MKEMLIFAEENVLLREQVENLHMEINAKTQVI